MSSMHMPGKATNSISFLLCSVLGGFCGVLVPVSGKERLGAVRIASWLNR
jgi:hypothetical protein